LRATINRGDNFATTTERAWDEVRDTNINGVFNVTKPVYKLMLRERSSNILNLISVTQLSRSIC
jgi:3-oxoacyl-[acyl-carrier protein] reductase